MAKRTKRTKRRNYFTKRSGQRSLYAVSSEVLDAVAVAIPVALFSQLQQAAKRIIRPLVWTENDICEHAAADSELMELCTSLDNQGAYDHGVSELNDALEQCTVGYFVMQPDDADDEDDDASAS